MPVDIPRVQEWLKNTETILRQADAIFQTPVVRLAVIPMLKMILPPLGVTPEQIAILDEHYEDLNAREIEARRRAAVEIPMEPGQRAALSSKLATLLKHPKPDQPAWLAEVAYVTKELTE